MESYTLIEWMKEINWILSLIVAIPLSITANILTPRFQNWFAKRSTEKTTKRLSEIKEQLSEVERFQNDTLGLLHETVRITLKVIIFIGIGNAITSIPIPMAYLIVDPIGALLYLIGITSGIRHLSLISRVNNFDGYYKEINAQIEILEKNGE